MTTKIETLTDEERHLVWYQASERGAKALRIIDAHAAERAALTEQVAQLTAALENIALGTVHPAEREVARLTEALAAAELISDALKHQCGKHLDVRCDLRERAENAERDRDAANALLERCWSELESDPHAEDYYAPFVSDIRAHLAGQPAARELESELTDLRRSYSENTEKMILAEARVRELESRIERQRVANRGMHRSLDERDAELAALRERVARAVTWLVSAQTAGFRFQANDAVKCALEALRGS